MAYDMEGLRRELLAQADEGYRSFHGGLLPGVENILGVRLPALRRLARQLVKGDWPAFLREQPEDYYEEIMLKGLVIAVAPMPMEERLGWLADFLPLMDNWAVCDCVSNSFKLAGAEKAEMYEFLLGQAASPLVYSRRFVLVMLLEHYVEPEYVGDICRLVEEIAGGDYYVDMAKAWLLSVLFVKQREAALAYLQTSRLDAFTFNKTIQKIRESRRVSAADKEMLRGLKRKD